MARVEQAILGLPEQPGGLLRDVASLRQEVKDEADKAQQRWDRIVIGMIGSGVLVITTTVVSAAVIPG